jgi:hypothetical protein
MTSPRLFVFLFFAFFLFAQAPQNAYAQVPPLQETMTLGAGLDMIEDSAERILQEGEDRFNSATTQAFLKILVLVDQLRDVFREDLDKLLQDVSRERRDALNQFRSNVLEVVDAANGSIDELSEASRELSNSLPDFFFAGSKPRIVDYTAPVLVRTGRAGQARITFQGVRLNNEKNILRVADKEYEPAGLEDDELTYLVDRRDLFRDASEGIDFSDLTLSVAYEEPNWGAIGKLINWTREETVDYKFSVVTIPDAFGSATVYYKTRESKTEYIRWNESGRCTLDPGSIEVESDCPFPGSNRRIIDHTLTSCRSGWRINPQDVRIEQLSEHDRCRNSQTDAWVQRRAPNAVVVRQYVESESRPCEDCRHRIRMRYGLMRTVETTPQRSQVVDGLSFTKPVAFDLPSTATGIDRVEVALVDGTSLTFTTSQKKRFVNATLASDQVIIEGLTGESGYQFQ